MLDNKGFDLWADDYDKSVGLSDEDGSYPFAGYKAVLGEIYRRVLSSGASSVFDIGFGTATLTSRLYDAGCTVCGQDFSEKMIEAAKAKMPDALLLQGDFTHGLATELRSKRFDAIIATYSLHHLTDERKCSFIKELLPLLNDGGCIYIADVAFRSRSELERCRVEAGDLWDDEELYFVFDELSEQLPNMCFEPMSDCSALLTIQCTSLQCSN